MFEKLIFFQVGGLHCVDYCSSNTGQSTTKLGATFRASDALLVSHIRPYYEQPCIIHQRHAYIFEDEMQLKRGRLVMYLDETWANAHDGKNKAWGEKDTATGGTIGRVRFVVTMCFIPLKFYFIKVLLLQYTIWQRRTPYCITYCLLVNMMNGFLIRECIHDRYIYCTCTYVT